MPRAVGLTATKRACMRAGTTRTGACPATVPAVATTVPEPTIRPAVNSAVAPLAVIRPSARGATLHVIAEVKGFPKASRTAAVKVRLARTGTPIGPDRIATRAAGPGRTVTVWVPAVTPVAEAVTANAPARVSR